MTDDLAARVQRLEDQYKISETVVRYAISLDRADWDLFRETISDPIFIDFSEWSGMEAREWARDEWANFARDVLTGFDGRHHASPNHVITFDSEDEVTCISYMHAAHVLYGAPGGDSFLMRGYYTNKLERAGDGWTINYMKQHLVWGEGNDKIFEESERRFKAQGVTAGA